jgi:hypothetical protein
MTRDCNTCERHVQGQHPAATTFVVDVSVRTGMVPRVVSCGQCLAHEGLLPLPYHKGARAQPSNVVPIETAKKPVAEVRKGRPVFSGVLRYFPDAILAVAEASQAGNDQHHPRKPLHWDRSKSTDHHDALARHLMDAGTMDTDGIRHSAKVVWRALAALQVEIEKERGGGS